MTHKGLSEQEITWDHLILGLKKTTKDFLENVLQNIIDSIVVTDLNGRIIFFNKFSEKLFRYRAEEVLGRHIVILGARRPNVLQRVRQGRTFRGEITLKTKDGKAFPARVVCVPIRDEKDLPIGMVGVARDITREKQEQEEKRFLQRQLEELQSRLSQTSSYGDLVGTSEAMLKIYALIEKVAPLDCNVLIMGESGTGKELIARAIHERSPRKNHNFVIADCALLSAGLLESELFGYEKGAFTGAYTRKIGHFEVANGGTLFLDEIGDLPLEVQGKLLRAVQERVIFRVGGVDPIKVDTRIIAATNQDLEEKVRRKQFREDLYYRLNVVIIKVLPLRERKEDIPLLTTYFLNKYAARFQKKVEIKQEVYDAFCQYPWPGNVRELENLIQNLLIVSGGNAIRLKDLPTKILAQLRPSPAETVQSSYKELKRKVVADFTRDFLIAMLRKNRGNVSKTAREIRLRRTSLQRLMKRFGLRASDFRNLPL